MKTLMWIAVAIAVALGVLAVATHSNPGYVQLVWPPHRIEISLVLAVAALMAAFAAIYVALRMLMAMIAIPQRMRVARHKREQRKARDTLHSALHEFFAGRYARAETAAKSALDLGEQPGLAATLAAHAAHELGAPERRDAYLVQGATHLDSGDRMKVITEARLMLKQQRAADALSALQALPQPHTAGLRLQLQALQLVSDWEKSLSVIDQLEQRKVYDTVEANTLRARSWAEHLKQRGADLASLNAAWKKIPMALQRDARVARAAADCYLARNAGEHAAGAIENSLDQQWDSALAGLYAECAESNVSAAGAAARQIERAERWLAAHAKDAALLCTLGRLCARQGLWDKARNYLDAAMAIEPTAIAHQALAQWHEQQGEADAAQQHYREGLKLALAR